MMAKSFVRLVICLLMRVVMPLLLGICLLRDYTVSHAADTLAPVLAPSTTLSAAPPSEVPNGFHLRLEPVSHQSGRDHPLTFMIDAGSIEADPGLKVALLAHGFALQSSMQLDSGLVLSTYVNGDRAYLNSQGLLLPPVVGAAPAIMQVPGHAGQLVVLRVDNAILTTCDMSIGQRHYEIRARTLYVFANGLYRAEGLAFYLAGKRIFALDHYEAKMTTADSTLMPSYLPQRITFGSSVIDGSYLGLRYLISLDHANTLEINGRFGKHQIIRGTASVSHPFFLTPHSASSMLSLVVGYHEDVDNLITGTDEKTNVAYSHLTVSRLPVIEMTMAPFRFPNSLHPFRLRIGGSVGEYREQPTEVTEFRSQAWGIFELPRFRLGPVDFYGAYGARGAFYGNSTLGTFVTKLALETPMATSLYANISYFHRQDSGTTPFLFDRVLLSDEVYTEISVPISNTPFRVDVQNREDIAGWTSRAFQLIMLYSNDCMSYGLSYTTVTKGFAFQFQLAAKAPFHRGASGFGFTQ